MSGSRDAWISQNGGSTVTSDFGPAVVSHLAMWEEQEGSLKTVIEFILNEQLVAQGLGQFR